jgi:hypothetical protein
MRFRLSLVAALVTVVGAFSVTAATAAAAPARSGSVPFTVDGTLGGAPIAGTFDITRFKLVDGVLTAVGTFSGGGYTAEPASAPVTSINGRSLTGSGGALTALQAADPSCQILDLTLGPLNLDLLGLQVSLNQVHLNITAQSGSGNLLGNLLCSVAHLLDNTGGATGGLSGLLQGITNLLNQILAAL